MAEVKREYPTAGVQFPWEAIVGLVLRLRHFSPFTALHVAGVSDLLTETGAVCVLPQVLFKQLGDVALNYINDHPEQRHSSAASLAATALAAAFPCPKK